MFSNVKCTPFNPLSPCFNYDFCVVTLSKDVTVDADIKGDVEIAKLPIKADCDKKKRLYHGGNRIWILPWV